MATTNTNFKVKNGLDAGGDISTTGQLNVNASAGDEGGQIFLNKAVTNTSINTGVNIDVYQNKLRFWESGGTNRGFYVDITGGAAGAGTSLTGGSTGSMNYAQTEGTKQSAISTSGTTLVSVSITTSGYPVQVTVTGDVENNSAGGWTVLQLYRGSTAIGNPIHTEGSAASENVPYALSVIDAPTAGTYTYALKLNSSAGGTFNFGESDGPVISVVELSGPKGDTGTAGANGQGVPSGGTAGQLLAKIDGTDYNTTWIDNFSAQVKHDVKLAESISKGQAVYVSSADGSNIIVSKASNATEATSSKTLGLLETGGATNDIVKVVTEGLITGLDTSTATAGDPVWLGTSGNLIYGLTNKPVAPAHLVYIGVVTRVHAVNGEIFTRLQNGFELNELHNVLIGTGYSSTPSDKDLLVYENATSLWKNKSFSTLDLLTATSAATTYQPLDTDLTAIAALSASSGFLKTNGSGTWSVDTNSYANLSGGNTFSGNQIINPGAGSTPGLTVNTTTGTTGYAIETLDGTGSRRFFVTEFGTTTIGGNTNFGGRLNVQTSNASTIGQIIRLASSPTADAFQVQASGGGVLTNINASGTINTSARVVAGGSTGARVDISPSSSSSVGLGVRGVSGQTANLQEWQTSTPTTVAAISATGAIYGESFNNMDIIAPATGSSLTVADLKTFIVNNSITLSGTDSSTLNIGTGGTLGTAAYTSTNAYTPSQNYILNGAFDIAQRGTSITTSGSSSGGTTVYTLDQWLGAAPFMSAPGVSLVTVTQQASTANMISGYDFPYYTNFATSFAVSGTAVGTTFLSQRIEDVRTLAGQQVTLSFWAKIASGTNSNFTPVIIQNFGTGGSTSVTNTGSAISLTTTWTRFSYTVTLGSMSGKTIGTNSYLDVRPIQLPGANFAALTVSIAGVKLEENSAATEFVRKHPSLAIEQVDCQRYYWRFGGSGTTTQVSVANGAYYNTTACYSVVRHPVSMRTAPSISVSDVTALTLYALGSSKASTNITAGVVISKEATELNITTAAITTTGAASFIRFPANSTNYLEFSAEI